MDNIYSKYCVRRAVLSALHRLTQSSEQHLEMGKRIHSHFIDEESIAERDCITSPRLQS